MRKKVSSVRGDYHAQMNFHKKLVDWLAGKEKRLLYISTANVFDGDLSRPWTENDSFRCGVSIEIQFRLGKY